MLAVLAVLAVAPAQALSRYHDGGVELSTVDGLPCFAVERYLGPISLIWTRKFRPPEGRFAVYSARVQARQTPHALMWSIDSPEDAAGWGLDRGQCIALGARPRGVQMTIGEQGLPLPRGAYEVVLHARDLDRDWSGRLTALFCVDGEGQVLHGSNDGGRVQCGVVVPAGNRVRAPAPLLKMP